jgi:integrase
MSALAVRLVDLGNGERLPILVRQANLLGVFEVTAFALRMRARGMEVKTIESAVRSVQLLYDVLHENGVSLVNRAEANEVLRQSEVDALAERCRIKLSAIANAKLGVAPFTRAWVKKGRFAISKLDTVSTKTTIIRVFYIAEFLRTFVDYAAMQGIPSNKAEFKEAGALTLRVLLASKPVNRNISRSRGLSREAERRLFEVTCPEFEDNPWKSFFLRHRNYVILKLLYGLGIRKGELLGIKVKDINFRTGRLFIAKRPDDVEDTRARQAKSKTTSRELPLTEEMLQLLKHYVHEVRPLTKRAKFHPFLIVADTGDQFALNSIDYMFSTIRSAYPEFIELHAHLLRHTINDRLAEMFEGLEPGVLKQIQNYLMGWTKTSNTSEVYTKGYVEEKAKGALLALQDQILYAKI